MGHTAQHAQGKSCDCLSPLWGSNPRPYAYGAHALPTELRRLWEHRKMITGNSKIRRVEEARQYTTIAWILIRQCQTFCRNASHKRARGGQHLTGDLAFLLAVAFARQCHAYALRGSAAPWPKRQVLLPARRGPPKTSPAEPGVPVVPAWFQGAGRSHSPQREKPTCKFRGHGGSQCWHTRAGMHTNALGQVH